MRDSGQRRRRQRRRRLRSKARRKRLRLGQRQSVSGPGQRTQGRGVRDQGRGVRDPRRGIVSCCLDSRTVTSAPIIALPSSLAGLTFAPCTAQASLPAAKVPVSRRRGVPAFRDGFVGDEVQRDRQHPPGGRPPPQDLGPPRLACTKQYFAASWAYREFVRPA